MFSQFITAQQLFTLHEDAFRENSGFLSPSIWRDAVGNALAADGCMGGFWAGDDWSNFSGFAPGDAGVETLPSITVPGPSGYGLFIETGTTGGSILPKTGVPGCVRMSIPAIDNHEAYLQSNGSVGCLGKISDTAGAEKFMAWEGIFAVSTIAANAQGMLLGLGSAAMNVANAMADDTSLLTVASHSFIGFSTQQAAPSELDIIYGKAGGSIVTVASAAKTLVVDTFYNVGLVYNPKWPSGKRLRFYIDNVEITSYVTGTNIATATFPDDVALSFIAGIKTGSAAASNLDLKRWRFFQQE